MNILLADILVMHLTYLFSIQKNKTTLGVQRTAHVGSILLVGFKCARAEGIAMIIQDK